MNKNMITYDFSGLLIGIFAVNRQYILHFHVFLRLIKLCKQKIVLNFAVKSWFESWGIIFTFRGFWEKPFLNYFENSG